MRSTLRRCRPWRWPRKMNLVVCPELPTASVVRRKRRPPPWTTLHLPTRPESTYKSGKTVQTTGATSQEQIANLLRRRDPGESHRVTLRIYHGWHKNREMMPIRRAFEALNLIEAVERKISKVSFAPRFQFGNELVCDSPANPLYSTYLGGGQSSGQKMVDTAISCDLLHILRLGIARIGVVVSDDDDYIPAVFTADAWNERAILLRRPSSDLSHVTDHDCSRLVAYWANQ